MNLNDLRVVINDRECTGLAPYLALLPIALLFAAPALLLWWGITLALGALSP